MRRKDREVTNIIEILQIIEKAKVLHLALFDADYPYIVPLHYGYEYTEGILIFYMHCAKEGHEVYSELLPADKVEKVEELIQIKSEKENMICVFQYNSEASCC